VIVSTEPPERGPLACTKPGLEANSKPVRPAASALAPADRMLTHRPRDKLRHMKMPFSNPSALNPLDPTETRSAIPNFSG
jgi:hypothetical protein